jgi:anti-sigma regulatory factor (Ser/Thr protein kinase)
MSPPGRILRRTIQPQGGTTHDTSSASAHGGFRHEALLYAGLEEFVDRVGGFVREGAEAGEHVLVVVGSQKIAALRSVLADLDPDAVTYADMASVGHNPARIIPAWRAFTDEHRAAGTPLRGVGEPIYPDRNADELVESQRHEALLNLAFATGPALWLACPYDTGALPSVVIDEALRTHPLVWDRDPGLTTGVYSGLGSVTKPFDRPLPDPPFPVAEVPFGLQGLRGVRAYVARAGTAAGLGPRRANDLVLAASEVATNSLRHGGGHGTVRVWRHGEAVVCEVRDGGRFHHQPLAGRVRPAPDQTSGFGLWLANQVCDLVQIRSFDDGSVVRLHVSALDAS